MKNSRKRARPAPPAATETTIAALTLDPENRRTHNERNLGMIASALREVGSGRSIVIDEGGRILAGNGVATAAQTIGLSKVRVVDAAGDEIIAVRRRGLNDAQKRALALYDNRSAELSTWNLEQLAKDRVGDLALEPFWTAAELKSLFAEPRAGKTPADELPAMRATTIKPGDLFQLGRHRLLCGDSADAGDVGRLFGGDAGDALLTSPPYNVGVKYGQHDDSTQSLDKYFAWLEGLARGWREHLRKGRALIWNVGVSPKTAAHRHIGMLEAAGLTFDRQFVWQKTGVPVPTFHTTRDRPLVRRLTSNYTHEMVYVLSVGALEVGPEQPFYNAVLEHDVFSVHQSQASVDLPAGAQRTGKQSNLDRRSFKAHPAPFPVALVVAFLQHYAGPGELVAEPFAGSGSTLIACEQLGLRGVGMEIDPVYCQLAIDRWEAFTGQQAAKLAGAAPRRESRRRAR